MDELKNEVPIFALEGSAFAGKTTLLSYLKENYNNQVIVIPEVGEYVGGDENFPDVPFKNIEDAKKSTHFFVEIEKQRYKDAFRLYKKFKRPVVMDRFTFLSSLFFYRLLKETETQSELLFKDFYSHAASLFSAVVNSGQVLSPTGVVFIRPKNKVVFNKRLSRGTKNSVFTKWESCQFMNSLYFDYLEEVYPKAHVILNTSNTEENLKNAAEKTLQFLVNNSDNSKPKLPFKNLMMKTGSKASLDLKKEFDQYKDVRKRAQYLMSESTCI